MRQDPPQRQEHAAFLFQRDAEGRTVLARQFARYPYHVTRPFYLDGDWPGLATLYLTSISGGLLQGDDLRVAFRVDAGAAAHVTDSAATKVHSMEAGEARTRTDIHVADNGYLEYVAEPVILFPDAGLRASLAVTLGGNARAVLVDSHLCHGPGGGLPRFRLLANEVAVRDASGSLLAVDRYRIDDTDNLLDTPGVLPSVFAQGSVYMLGFEAEPLVRGVNQRLDGLEGIYAGVTALPNRAGALARVLAQDGDQLRAALHAVWTEARRVMTGKKACPRRK